MTASKALVAATVASLLIGSNGDGRVRVLDPDLRIVPGTPALPKRTDGTVLSPDGRRFASWSFLGGRLTIRSRATFRPLTSVPIERGDDVYWPARDHIMTVSHKPWLKRPIVIRSFDVDDGGSRTVRLRGVPWGVERRGRVLRVLTATGRSFGFEREPIVVTDVRAAGVVDRRWRVPLPDGFDVVSGDDDDDGEGDAVVRLSRNLLLATRGDRHALIRVHSGTTKLLTGLPPGPYDYYGWAGPDLIDTRGLVARVDRDALTVTGFVDTGIEESVSPYGDGFVVGFGRARYDASLQRVAENAAPAPTQGFAPVIANDRLYDLVIDCDDADNTRAAIADATTGAAIAERRGRWKFGLLGSGYLNQPYFDDVCD
jgi:hypothetical protein